MTLTAVAFGLYLFALAYPPLLYAGFAAQAVYIVMRGVELGRIPLVGVHDTLGFLSASCVAFAMAVHYGMRRSGTGGVRFFLSACAILAALFTAVSMFQPPRTGALPPVLDTYWFELHVALSFFSYALFGIAAMLGIIYLRSESDASLDRMQYKAAFIGYCLFSLSMIFGGVWAYLAWGTYWLWTPKELWTSLIWFFYGFYLHARLRPGFPRQAVAWLGVAGFALVMFTYLGVGLLMKSSHSL